MRACVRLINYLSRPAGTIFLPAHYPLPTDYRNHGVVLSTRIKFSAVALARICKPPFGRIPPITVSPPKRIWVEFRIILRVGIEPTAIISLIVLAISNVGTFAKSNGLSHCQP